MAAWDLDDCPWALGRQQSRLAVAPHCVVLCVFTAYFYVFLEAQSPFPETGSLQKERAPDKLISFIAQGGGSWKKEKRKESN